MTSFPTIQPGLQDMIVSLPLHFDVSWAGKSGLAGSELCFGLEDGSIIFTDLDGTVVASLKDALSSEAINGVAFIRNSISVSTRKEVSQLMFDDDSPKMPRVEFPIGAHEIVAGSCDYFFAPVGAAGLIYFAPTAHHPPDVTIISPTSKQIYIYRLCTYRAASGAEIVVCAARRNGVAAMEFHPHVKEHHLSTFVFEDLDVIDVCSISNDKRSVLALGKDGRVTYFHDVLTGSKPLTTAYNTIVGTAYRILVVRNYIFVLTSKGLYVIANLIDHFKNRATGNPSVWIRPFPMEAVDMNVVGGRWILIVLTNEVLRFDVELLDSDQPQSDSQTGIREEQSTIKIATGKHQELQQSSAPIAIGA